MARRKRTRSTADYLRSAKSLTAFVPSLKKFNKRKTLTKSEKATIRRREKQLKNIPYLVPLSKAQAKKMTRRKTFLPGVQAVQLRGVGYDADVKFHGGDIEVREHGEHWIYWSLDRDTVRSRKGMRDAGEEAFSETFPIEKLSDMTREAFKRYHVKEVHLWAHAGIVGDGFQSLNQFVMWVNEKWNNGRYVTVRQNTCGDIYSDPSDPGKWINGIAILLEPKEYTQRRDALDAQEKAQAAKLERTTRSKKKPRVR